jgi:hypothetical protein
MSGILMDMGANASDNEGGGLMSLLFNPFTIVILILMFVALAGLGIWLYNTSKGLVAP